MPAQGSGSESFDVAQQLWAAYRADLPAKRLEWLAGAANQEERDEVEAAAQTFTTHALMIETTMTRLQQRALEIKSPKERDATLQLIGASMCLAFKVAAESRQAPGDGADSLATARVQAAQLGQFAANQCKDTARLLDQWDEVDKAAEELTRSQIARLRVTARHSDKEVRAFSATTEKFLEQGLEAQKALAAARRAGTNFQIGLVEDVVPLMGLIGGKDPEEVFVALSKLEGKLLRLGPVVVGGAVDYILSAPLVGSILGFWLGEAVEDYAVPAIKKKRSDDWVARRWRMAYDAGFTLLPLVTLLIADMAITSALGRQALEDRMTEVSKAMARETAAAQAIIAELKPETKQLAP
ncbi:MAG TPA: hypothetical protein VD997_13360 [Phycisphaerales bacterium]|nr:hypothetical protein [Phycisphaerales bacterium]